jgi:precorrin-2 C20-methyltransferase, putative
MKVANHLDTVLPLLEKLGLLQQTFMVSNSSTDKQQTLLGLEGITQETKLPYFTTFLVKKKIF